MLETISLADLVRTIGGAAQPTHFTSTAGLDKLEGGTNGVPVTSNPQPGTLICESQTGQAAELNRQLTGGINMQCTFFPHRQ